MTKNYRLKNKNLLYEQKAEIQCALRMKLSLNPLIYGLDLNNNKI
jgi:hypothetical protein